MVWKQFVVIGSAHNIITIGTAETSKYSLSAEMQYETLLSSVITRKI